MKPIQFKMQPSSNEDYPGLKVPVDETLSHSAEWPLCSFSLVADNIFRRKIRMAVLLFDLIRTGAAGNNH